MRRLRWRPALALGGLSVSDDGKYLAYSIADAGSDWNTWHVMEIDSGKKLDDELKWVKFTNVAWTNDNKGFDWKLVAGDRAQIMKVGERLRIVLSLSEP